MKGSLWNHVLNELKINLNPQTYETWFAESSMVSSSKERLIVEFNDRRIRDHVESRYSSQISAIIHDLSGKNVKIDYIVTDDSIESSLVNKNQAKSDREAGSITIKNGIVEIPKARLNPRFDFSKFVVGSNNQIAHAASLSVAQNPGNQYNPLFIWGGVGLGKTHLLQAICQKLEHEKSYLKVLYIHSEQFVNEIVTAIRQGDTSHFKLKYRFVDVLLIDDIQFIQGKDQTQIEFFHTFDTLYQSGRQIVISSDRPPKKLTLLTDRIRTRFEWGLITKISPPDLETRVAIIQNKASEEGIELDNEILYFIAKRITSNIRAIEGALTTLKFADEEISKESAARLLKDFMTDRLEEGLSIDEIRNEIASYFSISTQELDSKSREGRLILPRFLAIYFTCKYTKLSTKEIGQHFGGRDHSTIINARQEIEKKSKKDSQTMEIIKALEQKLNI